MTFHFAPRLMQAKAAAHYLGVSASKLRTLDIPVKVCGRNKLYDILDLDAYADALPYVEGDVSTRDADEAFGKNTCDEVFGNKW